MDKFKVLLLVFIYIGLTIGLAEFIGWILNGCIVNISDFGNYYIWGFIPNWFISGIPYSWWISILCMIPIIMYIKKEFQ